MNELARMLIDRFEHEVVFPIKYSSKTQLSKPPQFSIWFTAQNDRLKFHALSIGWCYPNIQSLAFAGLSNDGGDEGIPLGVFLKVGKHLPDLGSWAIDVYFALDVFHGDGVKFRVIGQSMNAALYLVNCIGLGAGKSVSPNICRMSISMDLHKVSMGVSAALPSKGSSVTAPALSKM